MRADDTIESFAKEDRTGYLDWCYAVDFHTLPLSPKGWVQTCQEDRLLGVDITGQCDNPALSQNEAMSYFNQLAIRTAKLLLRHWVSICQRLSLVESQVETPLSSLIASGFHLVSASSISVMFVSHLTTLCKMVRDAGLLCSKRTVRKTLTTKM